MSSALSVTHKFADNQWIWGILQFLELLPDDTSWPRLYLFAATVFKLCNFECIWKHIVTNQTSCFEDMKVSFIPKFWSFLPVWVIRPFCHVRRPFPASVVLKAEVFCVVTDSCKIPTFVQIVASFPFLFDNICGALETFKHHSCFPWICKHGKN